MIPGAVFDSSKEIPAQFGGNFPLDPELANRVQWEYRVDHIPDDGMKLANEIGLDGWEVYSIQGAVMYSKRKYLPHLG